MIQITPKSRCSGCHACASACPKNCIKMIGDDEGFLYPQVNESLCADCGICENTCPIINKNTDEKHQQVVKAYAAYTKDTNVRLESSSGGIFTEIAKYIIRNNGVVFGASFDENLQVRHIAIESIDDLWKLRGSKYVQSTICNAYIEAEKFLEEGRFVLFSGTPCQISGLYGYIKRDYPNLITQDIICHGVPSPLVWEKYLKYREEKSKSRIRKVFFRNKKFGWKAYSVRFEFENNSTLEQVFYNDLFMRGFLAELYLRPSCYQCAFKGIKRPSDFTLGDFWGIQNSLPQMDDNKGTSLLFVRSSKAETILNQIQDNIELCPVDIDVAIQGNPAMIRSAQVPFGRRGVIQQIDKNNFAKMIKSGAPKKSVFRKWLDFVKRVLGNIFTQRRST